jgi:hypothetical protein
MPVSEQAVASLVNAWELPPVPISHEQLDSYADHMNALVHSPQMQQINRLNEKMDKSIELVEKIETISEEDLARIESGKFSSILQAAALTGEMPQKLFDETMSRLKSGTLNSVQDLFAIFIQAQYPKAEPWLGLKKEIARMIRKKPGQVNNLMTRMGYTVPGKIEEVHLDIDEGESYSKAHIHYSLLVMTQEDGSKVAAPFYSVGHNRRAAESHAIYYFLEHYAFTELQPVEQAAIPPLLYASLDLPDAKKREIFEQMVLDSGAHYSVHTETIPSGFHVVLTVSGGDVTVPVITEANESTREEATHSAIRRMLRNNAFKIAMSRHEGNPQDLTNPQTVLKAEVERRGGYVEFPITEVDGRYNSGFLAKVVVHLNGEEQVFTAIEPNKDRALRVASAMASESLGTVNKTKSTKKVASWASQASRGDGAAGVNPF